MIDEIRADPRCGSFRNDTQSCIFIVGCTLRFCFEDDKYKNSWQSKKWCKMRPETFKHTNSRGHITFRCRMKCATCKAFCSDGRRCRIKTCLQHPYCKIHTATNFHVFIKQSTIPNAGLGLFALKTFHAGDLIAPIGGEKMNRSLLKTRYPDSKSCIVFGVHGGDDVRFDGACHRDIGHYSNTVVDEPTGTSLKDSTNAEIKLLAVGPTGNLQKNLYPWVVSKTTIPNGREIFTDYGKMYRIRRRSYFHSH